MDLSGPKSDRIAPAADNGALVRAGQRLLPWADQIAAVVAGDRAGADLNAAIVKQGARSISLHVKTGGKGAFVKLFHPDETTAACYARERDGLALLKGTDGVPRHMAHCDDAKFVISAYVAGQPVNQTIDTGNATATAFDLGAWLARYEAAAPTQSAHGNWFTYLSRLGGALDQVAVTQAGDILSAIPLCGQYLARDDAVLSNFIRDRHGRIIGFDFEHACFRPYGWDLVMTYQALVRRIPQRAEQMLASLVAGYRSQHRGALLSEELAQVAGILFCATAGTKRAA